MYVDAFVIPVPIANKDAYVEGGKQWAEMCKSYGALRLTDFWGRRRADGQVTSFPMAVKLEPGETVVLSWIEWPDKATRDAANEKMRADPNMQNMQMPFDGKRMIFGGFAPL
ncbi:MAG: DUF1428 domain-containing protein [Asticcacaulis sp.]